MKEYITQEQAGELLNFVGGTWEGCIREDKEFLHKSMNAAIQAYKDSLVAGVVLPEPSAEIVEDDNGMLTTQWAVPYIPNNKDKLYTADQLRQAIADALCVAEKETAELRLYKHNMEARFKGLNSMLKDALAKQVTRAPMFEFRECEDSQAAAPDPKEAQ